MTSTTSEISPAKVDSKPEIRRLKDLNTLVSLSKRRGFVFQSSEIYGGLGSCWDYGPLGVALKNNIKNLWWKKFVTDREDMYGVDAAILMNQKVWQATGHVSGFSDPLTECKKCKKRFRADQLESQKKCPECSGPEIIKISLIPALSNIHNG